MGPHDELVQQLRGQVSRGVVSAVDDSGDVQTVDLKTHDNVGRSNVEVHQPYGLTSVPLDEAPGTFVLAIGGDQGHQVALQLTSAHRMGNVKPGEVMLYDASGNRLYLKIGGNIDLFAAALMQVAAKTMTVNVPGGITFSGPVTFNGPVTFADTASFAKDVTIGGNLTVAGTVAGTGRSRGAL